MTKGRNTDLCPGSHRPLTFNRGTIPSHYQQCPECGKVVGLRCLRYVAGFPLGTIPRHNRKRIAPPSPSAANLDAVAAEQRAAEGAR